ncbi:MAG: S8 family serine peptidase, partial [Deinococcota bacterium]
LADKLDALSKEGQLSHGALVFNHVLAVLSHIADAVAVSDTTVVFKKDGHAIVVQGVDTQGFQTDGIANTLDNAVYTLTISNAVLGVPVSLQRIAVNMSFAIVPCGVLWDYQKTRDDGKAHSFEDYMALLTCENTERFNVDCSADSKSFQQFYDDLWQIATTALEDDALQSLIIRSTDMGGPYADALVFTASAGNYGDVLDYPLAPAAWPFVLSVSASNVGTDKLAEFSNPGAISMAGAWFELNDALGRAGVSADTLAITSTVYAGTSFAAPGLAVFAALDLSQVNSYCSDALLTYAGQANYKNVTLAEFVREVCGQ